MNRIFVMLLITLLAHPAFSQEASTSKQSVNPGINQRFLDPTLDIEEWVQRFEVESREVYFARKEIMRSLNLQPGDRVADVGAGTGFFTLLMSLHRYVSGDDKWDHPFEMIRDGANTFQWSHTGVAEHLARQWHNQQIGCHCENTKIWPY